MRNRPQWNQLDGNDWHYWLVQDLPANFSGNCTFQNPRYVS